MGDDDHTGGHDVNNEQLIETLLKLLVEGKSSGSSGAVGHARTLYGEDGMGGLVGRLHVLENSVTKLEATLMEQFKGLRRLVAIGITVSLFMFGILVTHLSESPKSAEAQVRIESSMEVSP